MFDYLPTRSGLIGSSHIVRIGSLCVRPSGNYHEIDYECANVPRSTTATEADVIEFLENSAG